MTPCARLDDAATTPHAPALVRVDARWGHLRLFERRGGGDAIVVTARRAGRTGYGAAATAAAALGDGLEWIWRIAPELVQLTDVRAMWAFGRRRRATIAKLPAAWAAIELALLDLFSQETRGGLGGLLGVLPCAQPLRQTATIVATAGRELEREVVAAAHAGVDDFVLVIGTNPHRDRARIEAIRVHVPAARIRARCTGLFASARDAYAYLRPFARSLWAIEDALALSQGEELATLAEALGCPVAISNPAHVPAMAQRRIPWVAALDIARAGGVLRALELARAAVDAGCDVALGTPTSEHRAEAEAYRVLAGALMR